MAGTFSLSERTIDPPVSTRKITDSDAHRLPVYTSSEFWLLSRDLFSDAEWSSQVVSAHFFWSALCHPAAPALLQRLTAIVINFWELCNAD